MTGLNRTFGIYLLCIAIFFGSRDIDQSLQRVGKKYSQNIKIQNRFRDKDTTSPIFQLKMHTMAQNDRLELGFQNLCIAHRYPFRFPRYRPIFTEGRTNIVKIIKLKIGSDIKT